MRRLKIWLNKYKKNNQRLGKILSTKQKAIKKAAPENQGHWFCQTKAGGGGK
jgi:hypothetical protein